MQKLNEDCYYFLTSTCTKGTSCPYRHNFDALTSNITCPAWTRNSCNGSTCPLRHSIVQRPSVSNGIACFYESTPIGCLKPDCTFAHSQPRPSVRNLSSLRSSTTNLVNKDVIKATTITPSAPPSIPSSSATIPSTTNAATSSLQNLTSQNSTPKVETPWNSEVTEAAAVPKANVLCDIAVPIEHQQNELTNPKIITDSSEKCSEETKTEIVQSRLSGNRNVVIADPASISNRTIVQATANRVVVPSDTVNSSKRVTDDNDSDSDLDQFLQQQGNAPSITSRLFNSTKPVASSNDTKPIRLNRDRLPAAKTTISNSSNSTPVVSNGEKASAGSGLSQDDERRQSRIERFKKNSIPPPRSVVNTSLSSFISTGNSTSSNVNERKRSAPEIPNNDSPPPKRLSSQQENNYSSNSTTIGDLCSPPIKPPRPRRRSPSPSSSCSSSSSSSPSSPSQKNSSPRQKYTPIPSMDDRAWKKEVDEFLAKTAQPKHILPSNIIQPQPVPLLSLRPTYIPPLLQPTQQNKPSTPSHRVLSQRPRQLPSSVPKRPSIPIANSSSPQASWKPNEPIVTNRTEQTRTKPIEQAPPKPLVQPVPPKTIEAIPVSGISTIQSSSVTKDDDESQLLELDEPTDVVDTFALIDEALFETDLELM